MKLFFSNIVASFLNIVMPGRCLQCGRIVYGKSALCATCFSKIYFLARQGCPRCGRPYDLPEDEGMVCPVCLTKPPVFHTLRSAFIYNKFSRELILPFKHADRTDMTPFLGNLMYQAGHDMLEKADLIIAVPLHPRKLMKRKYNQAALLAHYLAKKAKKHYLANTLQRIINTKTQGHDNAEQRKQNVKGAFYVKNPKQIAGKRIVMIDDVYTTGATLNECAKVLYKAGAQNVDCLTIARVRG